MLLWGFSTVAAESDKSGFTLFNPTPAELMRPLSADRPDFTESPYTVDAGHVQVELSFVDYSLDTGDERVHSLAVMPTNLKLGLTNDIDMQFLFDPYIHEHVESDGSKDGNGDLTLRWKVNLWGNDGGETAFGVMPFVKVPIASDDLGNQHVDGGVIFALAFELPAGWSGGLMFEVDYPYDEDDDGYDVEFVHTAVVGHDLIGELAGYVEYIGIASTDADTDYQPLIGTGLTYGINPNVQLDVGANIGLMGDADDVNVFSGITIRF